MEIIDRKRLSLLRLVIVIVGFGCILHLTHRECVRGNLRASSTKQTIEKADETVQKNAVKASESLSSDEVFHATAYCVSGLTKSGFPTAPGLVSADPKVIPLGSIIHIESPLMGGVYQVLDTGELVKGKIIDIFIPSYEKCIEFGRRMVKVKVLRYGFHNQKPDQAKNLEKSAQ